MSLIEDNEENYDLGVNPNEIFTSRNFISKGFLHKNDPLTIAIMSGIQSCDYEHGDVLEDIIKLYIQLTGSVNGQKVHKYIEGAGHRVSVNDAQVTKTVEGE